MSQAKHQIENPLSRIRQQALTPLILVAFARTEQEKLQTFFENIPADIDANWLFVQTDVFSEGPVPSSFFGDHYGVKVVRIEDRKKIKSKTFYFLPAGQYLDLQTSLSEGSTFHLIPDPDGVLDSRRVDNLMQSLSRSQGHTVITVIFENRAKDGLQGLRELKRGGGFVLAEASKKTSEALPSSRYLHAYADKFSTVDEMGWTIAELLRHPFIFGNGQCLKNFVSVSERTFDLIFSLFQKRLAIDLSQYNSKAIAASFERRMAINGISDLETYFRLLQSSEDELQALRRKVSVGLVRFFSDEFGDPALTESILITLFNDHHSSEPIKVWVAGCGTGQEAYTWAILLDEIIRENKFEVDYQIYASDVKLDALEAAERGLFDKTISDEVSRPRLLHYFDHEGKAYRVKASIRKHIHFIEHDLFNDPPFAKVDLISCRNNLRVFQPRVQKKILSSFYFALHERSFLLLGNLDSLGELESHFEQYESFSGLYIKASNHEVPIGSLPPRILSRKTDSQSYPNSIQETGESVAIADQIDQKNLGLGKKDQTLHQLALFAEENGKLKKANQQLLSINSELYKMNTELTEHSVLLQSLKQIYDQLLVAGDKGFILLDGNLSVQHISSAMFDYFKLSQDDIGQSWLNVYENRNSSALNKALYKVQETGKQRRISLLAEDKEALLVEILPFNLSGYSVENSFILTAKLDAS